jgi:hypothetical protein
MAMVARNGTGPSCQQLEEGLKSSDVGTRLRAVRELKNTVIGNRFKKQQFTGLVPALLELLACSSDNELVVQGVSGIVSGCHLVQHRCLGARLALQLPPER